mmetsp:Transcript_22547/g.28446  ORF Transcript_22547/g.28446 Transcript_22547/m.28446 type:complete len:316 (-) Transcript_22547:52-999(-)|eukprot:CAMPEP_0203677850 /NCGR_PEP_ID=MMETSP0090-20130426/29791_1 /ASSEMBLY_ACC=CAM_ASM_001088 /TAXON_ID=426623 /ORGANISM="Chaetoceros affinis, Strain CCMP159" /LENGTH=315 /DNA_ID=CAMNT_0050544873 /DNA_START=60 /DNA_END=1007 /DNA_ORIENTATION=+
MNKLYSSSGLIQRIHRRVRVRPARSLITSSSFSSSSNVSAAIKGDSTLAPDTNATPTPTTTLTPPSVTLYQYAICPFCNINKALLSYVNVGYDYVEVNPLSKAELKPWSGSYKKVPIAKIENGQVNGSTDINQALLKNDFVIHQLEKKWMNTTTNNESMSMEQFVSSEESVHWSQFAKDKLAPILYPNICRSLSESYQAFEYVRDVENFTGVQKIMIRGIGSFAMYIAASKIKSKRNITDERKALEDAIVRWQEEGLDNGNRIYSSGLSHPNLGDVSMFGVINSVAGLTAHDEVIRDRDDAVGEWYRRMQKDVLG